MLKNKICRRAPRAAHERDRITNEIVESSHGSDYPFFVPTVLFRRQKGTPRRICVRVMSQQIIHDSYSAARPQLLTSFQVNVFASSEYVWPSVDAWLRFNQDPKCMSLSDALRLLYAAEWHSELSRTGSNAARTRLFFSLWLLGNHFVCGVFHTHMLDANASCSTHYIIHTSNTLSSRVKTDSASNTPSLCKNRYLQNRSYLNSGTKHSEVLDCERGQNVVGKWKRWQRICAIPRLVDKYKLTTVTYLSQNSLNCPKPSNFEVTSSLFEVENPWLKIRKRKRDKEISA